MVFSSIEFLWFFMPVVLALYLALPPRARNALLAATSLLFYAWGAHALLVLFLGSIAWNFAAGLAIGRARERGEAERARTILLLAIGANVACLLFWKHAVFAVHQVSSLLGTAGLGDVRAPHIALPLGISFFTFHGISYVVDVYRGTSRPMRGVADYAQYMAFFPQLIAGPIVRYHEIDDQIREPPPRSRRLEDLADGFPRFALGLSKKVIIADPLGAVANAAFDGGAFGEAPLPLLRPYAWRLVSAYRIDQPPADFVALMRGADTVVLVTVERSFWTVPSTTYPLASAGSVVTAPFVDDVRRQLGHGP